MLIKPCHCFVLGDKMPKSCEVVIKKEELVKVLNAPETEFEKYVSPLLNQINNWAHGTRSEVVGQMSELIKEFMERYPKDRWTFDNWREFYLSTEVIPGGTGEKAIETAVKRIKEKLSEVRRVLGDIDEGTIRTWVEDLVLSKTFWGLMVQKPILSKLAEIFAGDPLNYRLSTPEEESKGIDGFVIIKGEEFPVSIKRVTYKQEKHLKENIEAPIVYYEKTKNCLRIDYSEFARFVSKEGSFRDPDG